MVCALVTGVQMCALPIYDRQTARLVGGGVAGISAFICSSDCRLISIASFIRGGEGHALPHVRAQRSPERVALASNRGDLLVSHRSARRALLHFERERLGLFAGARSEIGRTQV